MLYFKSIRKHNDKFSEAGSINKKAITKFYKNQSNNKTTHRVRIHLEFKIPREAFSSQRVFVGKVDSKCVMSFYFDSVRLISIMARVEMTAVVLKTRPGNRDFV